MTKRGAYVTDDCFRPIGELVAEILAGLATVRPVGEVIDLDAERLSRNLMKEIHAPADLTGTVPAHEKWHSARSAQIVAFK